MDRAGLRVGQGFDSHPFSDDPTRRLVLGGIPFPDGPALAGHSDADVIAHACADALLGPCGLGDIGGWFPDTDPSIADADSMTLLATVVAAVIDAGWIPVNIDCAVVAQHPKLAPHVAEMQDLLSTVVGAPVTIKGKRPEGIGPVDGIMCWATALVRAT